MSLFQKQDLILHSGQKSDFKIECDELSYSDVKTLCYLISKKFKFFSVFGIPEGGLRFQKELEKYRIDDYKLPTLIVDDVLTTGKSMEDFVKDYNVINDHIGVVIFARGKCPDWVTPIFQMW